ncbi:LysR family transcriptional regulator [Marimonas sp. MJW-29]|uniref:LysR family transcriptional regulator n=1 Tax=Sulfitobacter sediminis TaxID=3234186 RepID=A0ABV3RQJ7_9RHOB
MSYNLRHLKYFIATAELGQVSRAAIELSVSQSAVTAAVRELEAVLGAQLFIRSAHGMTLTEAGRRFLASGYEIVAKVEESLRTSDTVGLQGELSLAATYTVIGYFLPVHLERLGRVMPDVTLKVAEMTRQTLETALLEGRIEIAVALTSNISNPDLAKETLLSSPRRLWLPPRHRFAGREDLDLKDVAEEPYVMLTVDEAAHTAMRYWGHSTSHPNVVLRTSSIEAVRSMVANGQGVSILSDMVYRPWSLEGRRIEVADLRVDIPPMDVGLVWRKDATFTPVMTAFRDYFRGLFGTPQSALGALRAP